MCLGIPGRVVKKISEGEAVIDFGGVKRVVDILLVPNVEEGDYVVVHAGAVISKIDEETFMSMMSIFNELARELSGEREED